MVIRKAYEGDIDAQGKIRGGFCDMEAYCMRTEAIMHSPHGRFASFTCYFMGH